MTLPADFITRIHTLLGASEAPSFLDALRGVPSVSIRLNRRKAWEAPAMREPTMCKRLPLCLWRGCCGIFVMSR